MTQDATTALLRSIGASLADCGPLAFDEVRSRSWASATFAGARHELTLRLEGASAEQAAAAFVTGLDVAEFELRGHVLADIALVSQELSTTAIGEPRVLLRIEALTVEDC